MKRAKVIISLILVLCLTFCVAGCSSNHDEGSLKDNLIDGWDNWLQSFSKHALTKEKNLQGEKDKGDDAYTGTYTATYDEFNGKEFIFGGTALEQAINKQITVIQTATGSHGTNSTCAVFRLDAIFPYSAVTTKNG